MVGLGAYSLLTNKSYIRDETTVIVIIRTGCFCKSSRLAVHVEVSQSRPMQQKNRDKTIKIERSFCLKEYYY